MPIREHRCIKCGRVVEQLQGKEPRPKRCEQCGGRMAPVPISKVGGRWRYMDGETNAD